MNLKNKFFITLIMLVGMIFSATKSWQLEISAQAATYNYIPLGLSDNIRLKMEEAEPWYDYGIDQCPDRYECKPENDEDNNGIDIGIECESVDCYCVPDRFDNCYLGGVIITEDNPHYELGEDPNGDNFSSNNPNGYENNGKWDGDIFNDYCIDDDDDGICDGTDGTFQDCEYQLGEYYIDRVGKIAPGIFGPDGSYTKGENYTNLNDDYEPDQSLDNLYPECKYEEGGSDGWRLGEDEFDIPAPMDGHTNIRFSHLDWMNDVDINGNECCSEGIYFSVDKKSWKNHDDYARWDIYGNTWQLPDVDKIIFSWSNTDLEDLFWFSDDDSTTENDYEVYIFKDENADGKFNSEDLYADMNSSQLFVIEPEFLISSPEGARVAIVMGECALEGTDEYAYDGEYPYGDGHTSCEGIENCPREFCPDSFGGDYFAICAKEECIDPESNYEIACPTGFISDRIPNVKNISIDIEINSESNAINPQPGDDGLNDEYLSVCRYNREIKFDEIENVFNQFDQYYLDYFGQSVDGLYLGWDCSNLNQFPGYEPDCDEDININKHVWVQRWYNIDDLSIAEDVDDGIYCIPNTIDFCDECYLNPEDMNATLDCLGVCDGGAILDDCGECQAPENILNANVYIESDFFIRGPDVDCNGECLYYTELGSQKLEDGYQNYGGALINDCGICVGGNTEILNIEENSIDECDVCPPQSDAEPFRDCNYQPENIDGTFYEIGELCEGMTDWSTNIGNGIWDDGEEYIDLIQDNIYTSISSEYFYGTNTCWDDIDNDGQWDNDEPYTDENGNSQWDNCYDLNEDGQCIEEPFQDLNFDLEWTPAEEIRPPGFCLQSDSNYSHGKGAACDDQCFTKMDNDDFIYSQAFLDDCNDCSCEQNASFCGVNHLPNSGNGEYYDYEDIVLNSCTDSLFYNHNNGLRTNAIQNFSALSSPGDFGADSVFLNWSFDPVIETNNIGFNIFKNDSATQNWILVGSIWGLDNFIQECTSPSNCFEIYGSAEGTFGINVYDNYSHSSTIQAMSTAEAYEPLDFTIYNGNNLISFPGVPTDTTLTNIFSDPSLDQHINGIIGQAVASSLLENGNWVGTISGINTFSGYWLEVNYGDIDQNGVFDDELNFRIEQVYPANQNQIYHLQSGANLISYIIPYEQSVTDAFPDETEQYFNSIIGEGVAAQQLTPNLWVGNLVNLKKQKGYWAILDLTDCPILDNPSNGECYQDNFGNTVLKFHWNN